MKRLCVPELAFCFLDCKGNYRIAKLELYILCQFKARALAKKKSLDLKCPVSNVQKRKKIGKNASDFFSIRQLSTPFASQCNFKKVSYSIHIYTFWLASPANQRKSLHVLVLVTNFYIVNVG